MSEQHHTCILTIQADRPGGVPTVDDWWHTFLTRWGQRAIVLYAAFVGDGISRFQRLILTLRWWRAHPRPEHPHPTIANAPLPVPLWLFYFVPQWIAGPVLNTFDEVVVSGGPCLHALPLALRGRPYILWIGTLYRDELEGKALIGDAWARSVLASRFWPFLAWQERLVLHRASRILVQSPYTLRRIREELPAVADRLDLVMVPVDEGRFHALSGGGADRPAGRYILNVSRINDPRKNIPLLLEAFVRVHAHLPDLRLVLAGDSPAAHLVTRCEQLGIRESVVFRGKVEMDELAALYRGADLFVISSAQEGLGIVMIEAMACGTPVVATDCGGPEGIVINGQTGQIVPNNDPQALADALLRLLSDPAGLDHLRQGCLEFVRQNCALPVVERRLYGHFAAVFPRSAAARQQLFTDLPPASLSEQPGRPRLLEAAAAGWAVFVLILYLVHQWAILGPSIRAQLIDPLLGGIP
jgi:glycosyltransferase involved in cell wall biosynthesis